MHELGLARDLVRAVRAAVADRQVTGKVTRVRVELGRLAGIEPESLRFAFSVLTAETPLAGAELALRRIEPAVTCRGCGRVSAAAPARLQCAACGSADVELTAGREFLLTGFDVEE